MKTSIAMATYNGEKYLQEQLNSFLDQTVLPDELVISDDVSTDNTVKIIEDFIKISPFPVILVKNTENIQHTNNFIRAINLCSNELIFLADQDDFWFPDKISYIVDLASNNIEKTVFLHDAELTDGNLVRSGLTKQQQVKNAGLSKNTFVTGCCMAARKNFLSKILPVPADCNLHDVWIAMVADKLNLRLTDKKVLQYYRRHETNTSNTMTNELTKKSKLYAIKQRLKNCMTDTSIKRMRNVACLQRGMLALLENMLTESGHNETLKMKVTSTKNELVLREKRLQIATEKHMMIRAFKGVVFFSQGGYRCFDGLSSLLCDVIAKPPHLTIR